MEIHEFVTLHVSGMRINDLFSLNKSTIDYAKPVVGRINLSLRDEKYLNCIQ
ncbi:hypothetical protein [Prolixibacter sp. SD074]|uniref:hypothetical protein n=1 Tax=Prolixibacter sp. SD074 TaxID=2652391 RepID=UPI0012990788|nr:hypothetical protein [Prolixibacter sp. SD074]